MAESASLHAEICPQIQESEFRTRLSSKGEIQLYDELKDVVERVAHWSRILQEAQNDVERQQRIVNITADLLTRLDKSFPTPKAVALYNALHSFDGDTILNPDDTTFVASLPKTTLKEFKERIETAMEAGSDEKEKEELRQKELLKLRYPIAAIGVHVDRIIEKKNQYQETCQTTLDSFRDRDRFLRGYLKWACHSEMYARYYGSPGKNGSATISNQEFFVLFDDMGDEARPNLLPFKSGSGLKGASMFRLTNNRMKNHRYTSNTEKYGALKDLKDPAGRGRMWIDEGSAFYLLVPDRAVTTASLDASMPVMQGSLLSGAEEKEAPLVGHKIFFRGAQLLLPLYHLVDHGTGMHSFTCDKEEAKKMIAAGAKLFEVPGTSGYLYASAHGEFSPVYIIKNRTNGDAIYTTSKNELERLTTRFSETWEAGGVLGYTYAGN